MDGGDRPRAGLALAAAACLSVDVPEKDSLEHLQDGPGELLVAGEPKPELEGQAQDPVPDGDEGKHPVHQMRRSLHHAPAEARGTESAPAT